MGGEKRETFGCTLPIVAMMMMSFQPTGSIPGKKNEKSEEEEEEE